MASKVVGFSVGYGFIVVNVEHLDTDSFSRSVDRAANKHRKSYGAAIANANRYVKGEYAHTRVGHRKYLSTIVFSDSFEHAQRVLDGEVERMHSGVAGARGVVSTK